MNAMLISTLIVALAEMGDKTQLLAILLATRFKRPGPVIAGIFVATLANHMLAAGVGAAAAQLLDSLWFRVAIALSFIGMAAWTLIPDKDDEDAAKGSRFGPFFTTAIAFFLVEMGDKTQVATIALGARFGAVYIGALWVALGTTLGMMIANVPAVYFGKELVKRVPIRTVQIVAALLFFVLGLWLLAQTAGWIG